MTTLRASITELAAEFHIPRNVALRHVQDAGIPRAPDKTFPYDEAAEAISVRIDKATAIGNRLAGRGGGIGNDDALRQLAKAKADTAIAQAEKINIAVETMRGNLLPKADVLQATDAFAKHIRNGLMGVGSKVGARVVGKSADEAARIINDAIREALTDLADIETFILEGGL